MKHQKRRNFLKTLGLIGMGSSISLPATAETIKNLQENPVDLDANQEKPKKTKITLLQTTDIHCQIHPHDELFWENGKMTFRKTGGYAHIKTYFDRVRKENPNTFTIDTGDMFQGSAISVLTEGSAYVPILNQMDYDLYIPGNWEVVYYKKNMQKLMGGLLGPKVCANMYHDLGDGKRGELIFPPYYVYKVGGIKIGFIGYNDHLVPKRQSPNYSKGIIFTPPEENLAYYVDVLRNQEQCTMVIILSHIGLSQEIYLSNLPQAKGVDYIFGADTHERVRTPIQGKYAKVVEPGAFGSFVGRLDLEVENGKIVSESYDLVEINPKKYPADKKTQRLLDQLEKPFKSEINQVIGYSTIPLYRYFVVENTIDTMIVQALAWKLKDVDVILSNGFRFCPPNATPDHTGNIPITKAYLYDMLPVDSPVRTAEVTGAQIKKWLEKELNNVFAKEAAERFGGWVIKFHGMKVHFYAFKENGQRVQTVEIGGRALELERTYKISACERDGDPEDVLCRIPKVQNSKTLEFSLHDVIIDYLAVNSPVTPTEPQNAIVLDAPPTLLSQVSGVPYEFR